MDKLKKDDVRFAYVILHYQAYEETINCIDSIIHNNDCENYFIVVVDNNSPNNSGEQIKSLYETNNIVEVLLNEENLGFAKGNNIGFLYAKNILKCDFVAMLNNDTLLEQNDFTKKIIEEYYQSNFAVLGPKIILNDSTYFSNPMRKSPITLKNLMMKKIYIKTLLILNYLYLEGALIAIKRILKNSSYYKTNQEKKLINQKKLSNTRSENVQLHGCCLIFSPVYLSKFDGLDDRTFLYMEEEILFLHLSSSEMKSVYNPNIEIIHLEDASTNSITQNDRQKRRFIYLNHLESMKVIKSILLKE